MPSGHENRFRLVGKSSSGIPYTAFKTTDYMLAQKRRQQLRRAGTRTDLYNGKKLVS